MKVKTLVIDERAISSLDSALIEEKWFENFQIPNDMENIKRVLIDDILFIISKKIDEIGTCLIIDVASCEFQAGKNANRNVFKRILRVGMHHIQKDIAIPLGWAPFAEGSYISIYAETAAKQSGLRLYFDKNPDESSDHLFLFHAEAGKTPLSLAPKNLKLFQKASKLIEDAALTEVDDSQEFAGNYGIILSQPLGAQLAGNASLDDWYAQKLTGQQRDFVDRKYDGPVRLRGSAGTGKTQAIAIKVLKDLQRLEANAQPARLGVITHSSGLAHNVILGMLIGLDPSEKWREYKYARLWLGTLYELSSEILSYGQKGLEPLSLDGREGRELQKMLISDAVDHVVNSTPFRIDSRSKCSTLFQRLIQNKNNLINELMNEFACTIDADNIQKGTEEAERYIKGRRDEWQIPLNETDRRIVLDIHENYVTQLGNEKLLSMDQMIADLNRYLATHEWRQLRDSKGFDALFVDEYHYFNKSEAMGFHSLFKSLASENKRLPMFMAYDLKQSIDDAGIANATTATRNFLATRAGKSELVELTQVFRSTPEIAEFMADLDGAYPAMNLEEDWLPYMAKSKVENGLTPNLISFETNTALVDEVFRLAKRRISDLAEGGRQVAVLCLNDKLFDQYRKAGRINQKFVAITSRDQMSELRYAKNRCVFSMPEYVAGLQFDTVFLIHADSVETNLESGAANNLRRFVSRCYSGASRAARQLTIAVSDERGGRNKILDGALSNGSLALD